MQNNNYSKRIFFTELRFRALEKKMILQKPSSSYYTFQTFLYQHNLIDISIK